MLFKWKLRSGFANAGRFGIGLRALIKWPLLDTHMRVQNKRFVCGFLFSHNGSVPGAASQYPQHKAGTAYPLTAVTTIPLDTKTTPGASVTPLRVNKNGETNTTFSTTDEH